MSAENNHRKDCCNHYRAFSPLVDLTRFHRDPVAVGLQQTGSLLLFFQANRGAGDRLDPIKESRLVQFCYFRV